jgi:hypothetical protein
MAELVIAEPEKVCSKCRELKAATREFFSPKKLGVFGLHSWCKKCGAADRNRRRLADPEKNKKAKKRSDARRTHVKKAYQRRYWIENRERLVDSDHRRRAESGHKYNRQRRERRLDPTQRSDILKRENAWAKANRHKRRASFRKHWRNSPRFRLRTRFGNAITDTLRRGSRRAGWQAILGYTIDDLRRHLERQFLQGMTWANHGPIWHIDHIVPVAFFSFETIECQDFKTCFALANLRPLWRADNLAKRATRTHLI